MKTLKTFDALPAYGDIVKFVKPSSEAATFCKSLGITGKIISVDSEIYEINVGFDYSIFARASEIAVVATKLDIPLSEDML